ncbi:MAG: hypothetical protein RIT04_654 [Candidatus Parcubacteria bacterium]|jgi:A/G-specific adenine glycosylase
MKPFTREIWNYHAKHRRDFPWRTSSPFEKNGAGKKRVVTPYHIVVSEIMLQQTQAPRVVPKYENFIQKFPNWKALAKASTAQVLKEWQGLGYNRRALYLKEIAKKISTTSTTKEIPKIFDELVSLPGIGPNTAGSILAFAWNIPHPFIETNIRSVYIHFFFKNKGTQNHGGRDKKVLDTEILKLISKSLAQPSIQENPREWYYALMDYGVYLKATLPNPSRRSAHHVKQSAFKGSNRELRAQILRSVLKKPHSSSELIDAFISKTRNAAAIEKNISALIKEGFLVDDKGIFRISDN